MEIQSLLIDYGWSHPDGGPKSDNVFGQFLSAQRCSEKYMVVNSSFSFDKVGQVEIDLQLAMKGATDLDVNNIGKGAGVEDAFKDSKYTNISNC